MKTLTMTAVAVATMATGSLLFAQEHADHHQHDNDKSHVHQKDGEKKSMMGEMKMSPEMKTHHRLMMQTRISPKDPAAILAMQEELGLTPEQVRQIEQQRSEAREAAMRLLTPEQRQKVEALPAEPRSMMQMRQAMMKRTGGDMQGHCPMCQMMMSGNKAEDAAKDIPEKDKRSDRQLQPNIQAAVDKMTSSYLAVQQQLANDSLEGVTEQLDQLHDAAHAAMKAEAPEIKRKAHAVAETVHNSPDDLEEARKIFKSLSAAMVDLTQTAQPSDAAAQNLYVAYCPMAKAGWLQATKEITNPYMGQRMLRCGSVKSEIETAEQVAE